MSVIQGDRRASLPVRTVQTTNAAIYLTRTANCSEQSMRPGRSHHHLISFPCFTQTGQKHQQSVPSETVPPWALYTLGASHPALYDAHLSSTMARTDSPPDSPLSSVADSDPADLADFDVSELYEGQHEDTPDEPELPPAKRVKLGDGSTASSAAVAEAADPEPQHQNNTFEDMVISSDSEGDIPSSPVNARLEEDDYQEQVTVCAWEGCKAGDLTNMDRLVDHIHNDHIEGRQKKYTCEWTGCSRKSMPHASGYALKAHMRSHTREKPFYCYLPGEPHIPTFNARASPNNFFLECDRAFTRSDALAKHMRTVHETEALRPSDPVPKSMQSGGPAGKSSKLKIIIKTPQSHAAGQEDTIDDGNSGDESMAELFTQLTSKDGFAPKELAMPLEQLYKLCRAQLKWSEQDGEQLKQECKRLEGLYKQAWLEKEVLMDQVVKSELDWHERRKAVLVMEGASGPKMGPVPHWPPMPSGDGASDAGSSAAVAHGILGRDSEARE